MPEKMTFEEGAALPVNYITAYHMLFEVFRVRAGDHVLIHQAAGGVGTAATQLCRSVDGVVSYGTASAGKHDHVRDNGCTYPIDYHRVDYVAVVRELTAGRGVDLVLDALGGSDWKKGYDLLRPGGMLVCFGWANMVTSGKRQMTRVIGQLAKMPRWSPLRLMNENKGVSGINMGSLWDHADMISRELQELITLYEDGHIAPRIDRVFSFDRAADAHAYIEAGKNLGKVLLKPDP
jgi:NADPH:quinone reductase-like Zn-dependent oxidoreductase